MAIKVDATGPLAPPTGSCHGWQQLWQRLSVRFVLLLGVVVFFIAVGIDSLQQASAADMSHAIAGNPTSLNATRQASALTATSRSTTIPKTYLEFDVKTAQRLQHSDLTRASMTRSRLTSAHLFTRPVR